MGVKEALLRVAMASLGLLSIGMGTLVMLFPGPLGALGSGDTNTFLLGSWGWLTALMGLGVLIASRDPIRHILWLRIVTLACVVGAVYDLTHYVAGSVTFGSIASDLIIFTLFGTLFVAAYPRSPRIMSLDVLCAQGMLYTDIDRGGLFVRSQDGLVSYFPHASLPLEQAHNRSSAVRGSVQEHDQIADVREAAVSLIPPEEAPPPSILPDPQQSTPVPLPRAAVGGSYLFNLVDRRLGSRGSRQDEDDDQETPNEAMSQ